MMPVSNVEELDLFEQTEIPIDVLNRFPPFLEALGVVPYEECSYRSACKAGWAPQPTNDIQRAIWNEVHTLPSEPLTIKKRK